MYELEPSYMARDKKIIITTPQAVKFLKEKKIKPDYIVSTQHKQIVSRFLGSPPQQVIIYDITQSKNHQNLEEIEVADHINKTGINPLIHHKQISKNRFIDITKLYNANKNNTNKTTCYGKNFIKTTKQTPLNKKRPHLPSTYLCNIAILFKALGTKNIKGILINTTKPV